MLAMKALRINEHGCSLSQRRFSKRPEQISKTKENVVKKDSQMSSFDESFSLLFIMRMTNKTNPPNDSFPFLKKKEKTTGKEEASWRQRK